MAAIGASLPLLPLLLRGLALLTALASVVCGQGDCPAERLLSDFSEAVVGYSPSLNDSTGVQCVRVLAPALHHTPLYQTLSHGELLNFTNNQRHSNFEISLQLHGTTSQPICSEETLLIYRGIPTHLPGLATGSFNPSDSQPDNEFNPSDTPHGLVASLRGSQLQSPHTVVVPSPVATLLYARPSGAGGGFSLTVSWRETTMGSEVTQEPAGEGVCNESSDCSNPLLPHISWLSPSSHSNQSRRSVSRYHHTAVYDPCTESLWLFGGTDQSGAFYAELETIILSGDTYESSEINSTSEPVGRYLHSAVLIPCDETTPSSEMLVFGGFPSLEAPTDDLWIFSPSLGWRQLASAPWAVAGHTAVLAGDRMVVVGGVTTPGLRISPRVMVYSVSGDGWEVWQPQELGLLGVYGHSAVYDGSLEQVFVFGGYLYSRPTAMVTSELYSLDLSTRQWRKVQLASPVPSRAFHSAALVGGSGLLALIGGRGSGCGFGGLTLVELSSSCNGRAAITSSSSINGADATRDLWGHTAAAVTDSNQIIITGGWNGTASTGVLSLSLPLRLTCVLASSESDCLSIPGCVACSSPDLNFLSCQNNTSEACQSDGESSVRLVTASCESRCEQFVTYGACVMVDIAVDMQCEWNSLNGVCAAAGTGDQLLPLSTLRFPEACALPSCLDCTANTNCSWIANRIDRNPTNATIATLYLNVTEWGCYSRSLFRRFNLPRLALDTCPPSCLQATSCSECVSMRSPNAGGLNCSWSVLTHKCFSLDVAPLLCLNGECGLIVASEESCAALQCASFTICNECLTNPACVWVLNSTSHQAQCSDLQPPSSSSSPLWDDTDASIHYFYLAGCPRCSHDCLGRGACSEWPTCVCDVGFIGSFCETECYCNGHSYCANASLVGRATCLDCQHNTQGVSCEQCRPGYVGLPLDGGACTSCLEFCHGNSDQCVRSSELSSGNSLPAVSSGPTLEEAVCVNCTPPSVGLSCDSCLSGYYKSRSGTAIIECAPCPCNGHSEGCDQDSGHCSSCTNNTYSTLCRPMHCVLERQCNDCVNGYIGDPSNHRQCYREHTINGFYNYSLSANHTAFLGLVPDFFFSNVNAQIVFVMTRGAIDVYSTTDSRAIIVTSDPSTGLHRVEISPQSRLVSDEIRLAGSGNGSSVVYHSVATSRLTLTVPHTLLNFQFRKHYITVLAQTEAAFYFFYRQDSTRLNLYVFFGVFLSTFVLSTGTTISLWRFCHFLQRRRQRFLRRRLQQRRAKRPFIRIPVVFDTKPGLQGKPAQAEPKPRRWKQLFHNKTEKKKSSRDREDLELVEGATSQADRTWPLAIQPTHAGVSCVSSVLVVIPSNRQGVSTHSLCTGSALLGYSAEEVELKRGGLRARHKHRSRKEAALSQSETTITATTQL